MNIGLFPGQVGFIFAYFPSFVKYVRILPLKLCFRSLILHDSVRGIYFCDSFMIPFDNIE